MRKIKSDYPYRFTVKNPTNGRATFKIEKRKYDKTTWKVLSSERAELPDLDNINTLYKAKRMDFETARRNVDELVEQLYRDANAITTVVHNNDNYELLERYWNEEYASRDLEDPATARSALTRAIDALGSLSIYSAKRDEIQRAVDKFKGNKQRRIVASLTQLLRFAGRDFRLRRAKKEKRRVRSLSEDEFRAILPHLPSEPIRILHEVAFYTGARIGECFAIEPEDFNPETDELRIEAQIDKRNQRRDTKNDRERVTIVFPAGIESLARWFEIKHEISLDTRKRMATFTRQACVAEFPRDERKHLCFHDLRHCYARLCRERGLSTEDVADLIGDSIIVAKEHYTGFGPTDALMELRRKAIRKVA